MKNILIALSVFFGMCASPVYAEVGENVKLSALEVAQEICEDNEDTACIELVQEDMITYYIAGSEMKKNGIVLEQPVPTGVLFAQAMTYNMKGIDNYITWCAAFFGHGYIGKM
ncbi:MAG: hypothetical protein ACRDCE_19550 [Cetobacterium sp.]|uniref:hypothetical protein n=1 Tax=Cetobacterium sp. TaxID=2071632 RepID=UPI003EE6B9E7